jgi:hypothetical protein
MEGGRQGEESPTCDGERKVLQVSQDLLAFVASPPVRRRPVRTYMAAPFLQGHD